MLEVNHAPSFNCDTALDQQVKRALLKDTFKILKCTVKEKMQVINVLKQMNEARMIGITKLNKTELQLYKYDLQQKKLAEIDRYMMRNLGNYERLYPPQKEYSKTLRDEPKLNQIEMANLAKQVNVEEIDDQSMVDCPSSMKISTPAELPDNLQIDTDLFGYFNKFINLKEANKP